MSCELQNRHPSFYLFWFITYTLRPLTHCPEPEATSDDTVVCSGLCNAYILFSTSGF